MTKLIATVSTVVVREGKRISVGPGTKHPSFDFNKEEIEQINGIHPGALRKPVNESAEPEPSDETAPEGEAGATANKDPKTGPKKAKDDAAKKDSTSKKAKGAAGETKPKSTKAAEQAGDDDDHTDDEGHSQDGGDDGEDDDI